MLTKMRRATLHSHDAMSLEMLKTSLMPSIFALDQRRGRQHLLQVCYTGLHADLIKA